MTRRIVVISGTANSGKMPLARRLMEDDPSLCLVHRDHIREMLGAKVDEAHISYVMNAMTTSLIASGYPVLICAWNLEAMDMDMWTNIAKGFEIPLVWLDTRTPEGQKFIPPLPVETPEEAEDRIVWRKELG